VETIRWSPNGLSLAVLLRGEPRQLSMDGDVERVVGWDARGELRLWDVRTGNMSHLGVATWLLEWSPDSQRIASGMDSGEIRIWDVRSRRVSKMPGRNAVRCVGWSPDGRALVSANENGALLIWDTTLSVGKTLKSGSEGRWISPRYKNLWWIDMGKMLAAQTFEGDRLALWNITTGEKTEFLTSSEGSYGAGVAVSSDTRQIAFARSDGVIQLNDVCTTTSREFRGHAGRICRVALSPSGDMLASATEDRVRVWDVRSGASEELPAFCEIGGIAWSPTGDELAIGQQDGLVQVYSATTKQLRQIVEQTGGDLTENLIGLHWAPARRLVIVRNSFSIDILDSQLVEAPDVGGVNVFAWSPSDKGLAVGWNRGIVRIFDDQLIVSREVQVMFEDRDLDSSVWTLAWSPDGKSLATPAEGGGVRLLDLDSAESIVLNGHAENVWGLSWSPTGEWVASSADDGTVRIWPVLWIPDVFEKFLNNRTNVTIANRHLGYAPFSGLPWQKTSS
jgi:WD40 repeat protein